MDAVKDHGKAGVQLFDTTDEEKPYPAPKIGVLPALCAIVKGCLGLSAEENVLAIPRSTPKTPPGRRRSHKGGMVFALSEGASFRDVLPSGCVRDCFNSHTRPARCFRDDVYTSREEARTKNI